MLATGFAAWAARPVIDIRGRVGWRGESDVFTFGWGELEVIVITVKRGD